jgi:hypothetical protein
MQAQKAQTELFIPLNAREKWGDMIKDNLLNE